MESGTISVITTSGTEDGTVSGTIISLGAEGGTVMGIATSGT